MLSLQITQNDEITISFQVKWKIDYFNGKLAWAGCSPPKSICLVTHYAEGLLHNIFTELMLLCSWHRGFRWNKLVINSTGTLTEFMIYAELKHACCSCLADIWRLLCHVTSSGQRGHGFESAHHQLPRSSNHMVLLSWTDCWDGSLILMERSYESLPLKFAPCWALLGSVHIAVFHHIAICPS